MTLTELNKKNPHARQRDLLDCCGSVGWVSRMTVQFPFKTTTDLLEAAKKTWFEQCTETEWKDAFAWHPKIGDLKNMAEKFASTQHLAGAEQSGVNEAPLAVLQDIALLNVKYEEKFGYIFIVCATGKSAAEMLQLLRERLPNDPAKEIQIAMQEQAKITELRLQKLIN